MPLKKKSKNKHGSSDISHSLISSPQLDATHAGGKNRTSRRPTQRGENIHNSFIKNGWREAPGEVNHETSHSQSPVSYGPGG